MLRYSLGLEAEALAVERAIGEAIAAGARTADITTGKQSSISTAEMTAEIISHIRHTRLI
jgi:3-isopropylmalate dehydrogenase